MPTTRRDIFWVKIDSLVKTQKCSLSLDWRGPALLNSLSSKRDPFGGFNRVKVRVKINDITAGYVPLPTGNVTFYDTIKIRLIYIFS